MRELERNLHGGRSTAALAIIGAGRLGTALAIALRQAGFEVAGPFTRGEPVPAVDAVLLCVPDSAIPQAAAALPAVPLVGHCSGACRLDVLGHREAFSLHPLMTVTREGGSFAGAGAAISGSTPRAERLARQLAETLGMIPIRIQEEDRETYHAAASVAANFLVTLEGAAEELGALVGMDRRLLVPLARAALENWAAHGAQAALTGPVARGDERTVAAQRLAVSERAPQLLELFDTLVTCTRALAGATPASAARVPAPMVPTPAPAGATAA